MATSEATSDLALRLGGSLRISDSDNGSPLTRGKTPTNLENLECPFSWNYNFKDSEDIVSRIEDKLQEQHNENELLHWKNFILNLVLCYEFGRQGNVKDALKKQAICEDILGQIDLDDPYFVDNSMRKGLKHVSLACKSFLLSDNDEIKDVRDSIVLYEDLEPQERASVLCVKGSFCAEYGYNGVKESMSLIEEAIAIDKDNAMFNYLLVRSMGRLRRVEKNRALPSEKEIKLLEHCCKLSDNISFVALLAQTYRETARNIFYEKKNEYSSFKPFCDTFNKKAAILYRQILQKHQSIDLKNVSALIRCANGFMKLPRPWKDMENAKSCILKALNLSPENPTANHVAGTYFSMVNNIKDATHYLSKAAGYKVFGAEMDLICLKVKYNETYNPCADLKRCLKTYEEKPRQESLLCSLGFYYYKHENNFKNALEYWLRVIEENINSDHLRVNSDFKRCPMVNINEIIVSEIMKLLDGGNISTQERELYDNIITKYIEHQPELITEVTDIDVGTFENKKFEYLSWKSNRNGKKKYY